MDYYRRQALNQIRNSYKKQKIPWKAWQTIETDEFSLSQHRSFQVAIARQKKLRAYGRLYIGSKFLGAEQDLFGDQTQFVQSESFGIKNKKFPNYLLPIERLLSRFQIEENPIADLRKQFPNYTIVEIGRLYVDSNYPEAERQVAKKALFSTMVRIMKETSPELNLNKVIMVVSSGPFGSRVYPGEFGVVPIMKTKLKFADMLEDIDDKATKIGGTPIKFNWVDSADSVFEDHHQEKFRDLSILATTADQVEQKLKEGGNYFSGFPRLEEILYQTYESKLDEPL